MIAGDGDEREQIIIILETILYNIIIQYSIRINMLLLSFCLVYLEIIV